MSRDPGTAHLALHEAADAAASLLADGERGLRGLSDHRLKAVTVATDVVAHEANRLWHAAQAEKARRGNLTTTEGSS